MLMMMLGEQQSLLLVSFYSGENIHTHSPNHTHIHTHIHTHTHSSTGEQCPHVVSLLSESFNPHVRCGSAMALGIACAGTGNKEALSIIEPMLTDSLPFVQQVQ